MPPIEQIWPFVQRELDRVGGDPGYLPPPVRTVWLVASAQGCIDSGGLRAFFEAVFPGDPPFFLIGKLVRENRDVWKSLWKYIEVHKEFFRG